MCNQLIVKLLQTITVDYVLPGRILILLAGVLTLGACATSRQNFPTPPPLLDTVTQVQAEEVDVLAVTPEMEAFLERYILPYHDPESRLNLLMLALTSTGVLGFDYDEARTLTAADAFNSRSGNCIGFANLMIAMAREVGLEANYQEVLRRPEWTSRQDTLLLIKHINVVVSTPRYSYVVDISGIEKRPGDRPRIISDAYAKALYYNNIGAEALIENQLPTAWAYLVTAIDTGPGLPDPWVNLGVVYNRNAQVDAARQVYETALQIDPTAYSAMNNLYEIYLSEENQVEADALSSKVERYRKRNPYYLMQLSEESLDMGRFDESLNLIQRAIMIKNDDYKLYFSMAKTQYLSGETQPAQDSLLRARELAPQDLMVFYNRPLHELVMEGSGVTRIQTP
jgi:tetratricopeptide (TPR) repeat protein